MLLGKVDVEVALAPVAPVQAVVGTGLLLAGDGDIACLGGPHTVHHGFLQLVLVDDPAVHAARHGDLLAVGARERAPRLVGVARRGDVLHPRRHQALVHAHGHVVAQAHPVGYLVGVHARDGRVGQLQVEIGFEQRVRVVGGFRQARVVSEERRLLQRVLAERRRGREGGDGRAHGREHPVGIERRACRLGAHHERRAARVVVEPGVARRHGPLVERVDGGAHGLLQLSVRGGQPVGLVARAEHLHRPGPGVRVGVHGIRHALDVDAGAHVRGRELEREPLPRHVERVALRDVGQQVLHLGGRLERHVLAHDRGAGHEAVHERERARQVDHGKHGRRRAAGDEGRLAAVPRPPRSGAGTRDGRGAETARRPLALPAVACVPALRTVSWRHTLTSSPLRRSPVP